MIMIAKEFPVAVLKAPMCLASIDNTKHVCCRVALSPYLPSHPLSAATRQPALLLPPLRYCSLLLPSARVRRACFYASTSDASLKTILSF